MSKTRVKAWNKQQDKTRNHTYFILLPDYIQT